MDVDTVEEKKLDGNRQFAAKQYDAALASYQRAISLLQAERERLVQFHSEQPEEVDLERANSMLGRLEGVIYSNMAACHVVLSQYEEAIVACTKALQYDATQSKAYWRKVHALLKLERVREACETLVDWRDNCSRNTGAARKLMQKIAGDHADMDTIYTVCLADLNAYEMPQRVQHAIWSMLLPEEFLARWNESTEDVRIGGHDVKQVIQCSLQNLLLGLCLRCPQLRTLRIGGFVDAGGGSESSDRWSVMDISQWYFGCLRELELNVVNLESLEMSAKNAPRLESLHVENTELELDKFELALPNLQHLTLNYVAFEDASGMGLSFMKCPKLATFNSYKCRSLSDFGDNGYHPQVLYCPNLGCMRLHRAECLEGLTFLYAPKLTQLDLQAAYDCQHVRIHNCPNVTKEEMKKLTSEHSANQRRMRKFFCDEMAKWKDGTYGRAELIDLNIVGSDWEGYEGGSIETDEIIEQCLHESIEHRMPKGPNMLTALVMSREDRKGMRKQPQISINMMNMGVSPDTLQHLAGHPRVGQENIANLSTEFM